MAVDVDEASTEAKTCAYLQSANNPNFVECSIHMVMNDSSSCSSRGSIYLIDLSEFTLGVGFIDWVFHLSVIWTSLLSHVVLWSFPSQWFYGVFHLSVSCLAWVYSCMVMEFSFSIVGASESSGRYMSNELDYQTLCHFGLTPSSESLSFTAIDLQSYSSSDLYSAMSADTS